MGLRLAALARRFAFLFAGCCFALARCFAWLFLAAAQNSQGEGRANQARPRQAMTKNSKEEPKEAGHNRDQARAASNSQQQTATASNNQGKAASQESQDLVGHLKTTQRHSCPELIPDCDASDYF